MAKPFHAYGSVQDAGSYQAMLELLDRLDAIDGVRRGLEQMERGEGRPAAEAFAEFRAQHGMASE